MSQLLSQLEGRERRAECLRNDSIGPRQICRPTCKGCPALKTEDWVEYPDGERDSGTTATCSAAGDKCITTYWHESTVVPAWCPAASSAFFAECEAEARQIVRTA